ncbi:aldo/keto reductase [Leptospira sp. WS39.C2]
MTTIRKINLGNQGLVVPIEGLGCMGMTKFAGMNMYGSADETESIATIHRALELGVNFLDTADLYGPQENERLLAKAIKGNRNSYIIATKFGYEIDEKDQLSWQINGRPDYIKKAIERSLKNLGTDYIDLYYLHRLDPKTPIEDTVGAMSELVKEGKIGYIGLSEVSSRTIKRAHVVHPLTAVQREYSLFEREVESSGTLATMNELKIGLVAYSPLSRGFLTGEIKTPDDFEENDFRRNIPRYQGDQFYKNIELVNEIEILAAKKGVSPSQLAIAWILNKDIVAIPGTKRVKYVEDNIAAADIILNKEEMEQLESIVPLGTSTGDPYDATSMTQLDR